MICGLRFTKDGIEHEAACSGLAAPHDSATAILSRVGYAGPHVPVVVVECDELGTHKPGQILGFANASSWWK